ncbi:MAG: ABC transporter ATP-binding protein [Synechococcus sp.]
MVVLPADVVPRAEIVMLTVERVSKSFGDRLVLDRLSLEVKAGEIYGLLGPNGAGKTTTINLICGLLRWDSGTIKFDGKHISSHTKSQVGLAPQDTLLYNSLTCVENLDFFARIYGVPLHQRQQRISDSLAAVSLSDRADSIVSTLSGGMQRRLNIAIALIHHPQLAILDEPTTGLDIEARFEVWQLIRDLKRRNIAVLLTTHLLDEAERLCHRIGILKGGHIVAEGSLQQLKALIPASEIITIETSEPQKAIAKAQTLGWTYRSYGEELAFWLPEAIDLKQLVDYFDDTPLESVSRQPIRLEHVYREIAGGKHHDGQPRNPASNGVHG